MRLRLIGSFVEGQHTSFAIRIVLLGGLSRHPLAKSHDAGHDAVYLLHRLLLVRLDVARRIGLYDS